MNRHIYFGIIGLIVGLVVGFFAANSINRNAVLQPTTAQNPATAPFLNQPTADIKEQTQAGMLPEVGETLDRAKNEPNNFEAQIKAGDMYAKIKKFDTAVEFYEQANRIKPEDYETIVKIGNTYLDSNQFEKAEKWYAQAVTKKPTDINVRTDLGITFVEREKPDLDRGIKEFQTSLQINPNHETTLYNLGIAYYKKGDVEETKKILAQLETLKPTSPLVERLKQVLR